MIVEDEREPEMTRRQDIADTGVALIAQRGVRALTHRAVDSEASLPPGSTSYYARTRRDLIALVVERLADYTQEDLNDFAIPAEVSRMDAVHLAAAFLDQLARHEDAQAVRFALLFELRGDQELRAMLTADAPVRGHLIEAARGILHAIGVDDPSLHAPDLVGLIDALLMYRTSAAAPIDAPRVLGAYLVGLR
jgi:DNA-binding transcriptional regulator YbjK